MRVSSVPLVMLSPKARNLLLVRVRVTTSTANAQLLTISSPAVAEHVTSVLPTGNVELDTGSHVLFVTSPNPGDRRVRKRNCQRKTIDG